MSRKYVDERKTYEQLYELVSEPNQPATQELIQDKVHSNELSNVTGIWPRLAASISSSSTWIGFWVL